MQIETTRDALTALDGYQTSEAVLRAIASEAGGDLIDWARGYLQRDDQGTIPAGVALEADRIWSEPTAREKSRVLARLPQGGEPLYWGNHDVRGKK